MEIFMINNAETIAYLDRIDEAYFKGKIDGLSRYSIEWGKFSREMNLEIRGKIEAGHPEKLLLKMIMPYWTNRSIMLELYFTKKHKIKQNRLHFLSKECQRLRTDIGQGKSNESDWVSMLDIARMTLKGAHI